MHWAKVTRGERGMAWLDFLAAIQNLPDNQLWRHNAAGDLPGANNTIDPFGLADVVRANTGKRGFTYTHKPMTSGNRTAIANANRDGFTVNLSADTVGQADALSDLGIAPVVVVLGSDVDGASTKTVKTPAGRTVVVCPATYRDDVTCANCGLCAVRKRQTIVGFPAHGASKARASAIARA